MLEALRIRGVEAWEFGGHDAQADAQLREADQCLSNHVHVCGFERL